MVDKVPAVDPGADWQTGQQAIDQAGDAPFKTQEEADKISEQRKALVKRLMGEVKAWKKHHEPAFKKMKAHVKFVKNSHGEQWRGPAGSDDSEDRYVANITYRFIAQKVSSLYARDPRVRARRRPMIDNVVWDGRQETLQTAMATLGLGGGPNAGPPPDPKLELEKAKLAGQAQKDQAELTLAAQAQQAEIADKRVARQLEQQKLVMENGFKTQEIAIKKQELVLKAKALDIQEGELRLQQQQGRENLAAGGFHKNADRNAKIQTAREGTAGGIVQQREKLTSDHLLANKGHAAAATLAEKKHAADLAAAKKKEPASASK